MNFDKTVVYKNELNSVSFNDFTPTELDLLFAILSKIKNKGTNCVKYSFSDLKNMSQYKNSNAKDYFANQLDSTYQKLLNLNIRVGDDERWARFVLFTKYEIDVKNSYVTIRVNEEFVFLINQIVGNFTKFELKEFSSLSSTYSKNMYRLLKQWRSTGFATYEIKEFRRLLNIPDSYGMGHISQKVLRIIKRDLSPYFKNLRIKKVKGKGKDSRKIVRLEFKFKPEDVKPADSLYDIDYDREYTKSELLEFPIEIANSAQPVFGIYREDLDIVGVYEADGSFTVFNDQENIKWKLEKPEYL